MKKLIFVLMYSILFAIPGCSDSMDQNDTNNAGDAGGTGSTPDFESMVRVVLSDGIERHCEYFTSLEGVDQFSCAHSETDEIHLCTREHDFVEADFYCEAAAEGDTTWTPCEEYHQAGDGKSGRSCWAPPQDYCRNGCGNAMTWFCKDDASACCWHGCDCFGCDWIEVAIEGDSPRCQRAGESTAQSDEECDRFFAKLPAQYQDCIQGNCDDSVMQELADSAACKDNKPNFDLLICI